MAEILEKGSYKSIAKTRYTNDKQITDHYAIIPTGQTGAYNSLSQMSRNVYETIVRRFLAIFYPPAVYQKISLVLQVKEEKLFSSFKVLLEEGYLKVSGNSQNNAQNIAQNNDNATGSLQSKPGEKSSNKNEDETEDVKCDADMLEYLKQLKKGQEIPVNEFLVKEGKTSPPKRYNSGSLILAMENAGQLIEDE